MSLLRGGSGRYGASTFPFEPGKVSSLALIRCDNGPDTVGEMTEENEGGLHSSCCSIHNSSSSNSTGCSSRKQLDGIWHGAPTISFDPGKMVPVMLRVTKAEDQGVLMDSIRFVCCAYSVCTGDDNTLNLEESQEMSYLYVIVRELFIQQCVRDSKCSFSPFQTRRNHDQV